MSRTQIITIRIKYKYWYYKINGKKVHCFEDKNLPKFIFPNQIGTVDTN